MTDSRVEVTLRHPMKLYGNRRDRTECDTLELHHLTSATLGQSAVTYERVYREQLQPALAWLVGASASRDTPFDIAAPLLSNVPPFPRMREMLYQGIQNSYDGGIHSFLRDNPPDNRY